MQREPIQIPETIGAPFGGGYFAGVIHAPGHSRYALIVAPKAGGETAGPWQTPQTDVPDATSWWNGAANTDAMARAGSALAAWARGLELNGFADWYLPARDELELLYRGLKPTGDRNHVYRSGENPSSAPVGYPYTAEYPPQTPVQPFQVGGPEAFEETWHWASTQPSRTDAWDQYFGDGGQSSIDKSFKARARAVRRLILD